MSDYLYTHLDIPFLQVIRPRLERADKLRPRERTRRGEGQGHHSCLRTVPAVLRIAAAVCRRVAAAVAYQTTFQNMHDWYLPTE